MSTRRVTVSLDEELVPVLDQYAREHHWSRSTAVAVLIQAALTQEQEGEDHDEND